MRVTDIRPPEDVPRLLDVVARYRDGAEPALRSPAGPWRHRLKDGRIGNVHIASHAIHFAGRRAALLAAIDLTELRQTQEALAKYSERRNILHEIDRAIAARPPVEIAEAVLRRLRELLRVPRAIVNLFDLETGQVEWLAAAGGRVDGPSGRAQQPQPYQPQPYQPHPYCHLHSGITTTRGGGGGATPGATGGGAGTT